MKFGVMMLPLAAMAAWPASAADPAAPARIRAALGVPDGAQPGCAVGIFRAGKPAELVNAGLADVATGRAIGSDTQFYAASVSKQFTAVAVLQQVAAGKVKLTDSVRKYIPELAPYADKVTVQMLLNMTGGVRDSLSLLALEGYDRISAPTRKQALEAVYRQQDAKFEPGTQYDYTNGGYLLLSEIVERAAGQPFETYVNAKVLKPLGMTRSFMLLGSRATDPDVAKGYVAKDGKVTDADEYPLFGGSGGLITTVNDLAKWDADIDNGHKVWTAQISKWMAEPGKFLNGAPAMRTGRGIAYGNALLIGNRWFHHTGGAVGFKTLYGHLREKRMGVALLCNNGAVDPVPQADKVVAALNEGLPAIGEPSADGSAINGSYRNVNLAGTYWLAMKGDALEVVVAQADGSRAPAKLLKRAPDGSFKNEMLSLTPDDDARGFTLEIPRVTLHFSRTT
ncbi:class A beta-lactamase-related serine hydrolase [Sphingomonas koreensis]|uniref:serine hydrolase domain-containing protein n=1 Tax=Sphingomonas koreensis TaxID=93064 RepID=UPI000832974A|nr:serine hydrolase domain-containing protein [Sphingomonas koreensis]PJI88377.1 CubicO group peptidase (beta-lactamase class C family) [Sphingomonas koreensis]RSU58695.1 class A beta-lactamase-related serine hydrolase [Sphingomonas koreensis]RSU66861.1 class A beta-lactamase-related serine hydrolase [Sphingomonas koreensis]